MATEPLQGAVRTAVAGVAGRYRPAGDVNGTIPVGSDLGPTTRSKVTRFLEEIGWRRNYDEELDDLFANYGAGTLARAMMELLAAQAKGLRIGKASSYYLGIVRRLDREKAERDLLAPFPEHERKRLVDEAFARVRELGMRVSSTNVARQLAMLVGENRQ